MTAIRHCIFKLLAVLLTLAAVTMCITLYTGESMKLTKLMEDRKKLWLHEYASKHKPDPTKAHLHLSNLKAPEFLKDFRNPCYRDDPKSNRSTIYCVPYAYQLGFPKSGTTFLRTIIGSHPLLMPQTTPTSFHYVIEKRFIETRKTQELSDFTARTYVDLAYDTVTKAIIHTTDPSNMNIITKDYGDKFANRDFFCTNHFRFLKQFPQESADVLRKAQGTHKYPAITVDMTLAGSWQKSAWKELEENQEEDGGVPNHSVCELMKKINPKAKIYVIMREPISRLFSWYTYTRRLEGQKTSLAKFHEFVLNCTTTINDCLASGRPETLCTFYDRSDGLIKPFAATIYYYPIRDCVQHIPLSNFLVIKFEDFTADTENSVRHLYAFLGLPPLSDEAISFIKTKAKSNKQKNQIKEDEMWPETRSLLETFFKPYNEKLASLLKDRRFLWED